MNFERVNNDSNGNPRYVVHFLECEPDSWKDEPFDKRYQRVIKLMNKINGRKFNNKQYGGGIVFSTYNLDSLEKQIKELMQEA
jgi:hypothetical protein